VNISGRRRKQALQPQGLDQGAGGRRLGSPVDHDIDLRPTASSFERNGWVWVMADEFDGRFKVQPVDYNGEITVDGLTLFARPKAWSERAGSQ
jgi:hypothetical protein